MPNTATEATVEEKAATEAERQAAIESAGSVAEAVKRVADAAVAAVRDVKSGPLPEIIVTATLNGKFRISGTGLGTSGTVTFDGVPAHTTGWGATYIEGQVPSGVSGNVEVVVQIDEETSKTANVRL